MRSTSRGVITFGAVSALAGLFLQYVERVVSEPGELRWLSTVAASAAAGWIVGRRGRGLFAVLAAGEAGLGVGAVDGALRGSVMYTTDPEFRRDMPSWAMLYVLAGTLGVLGTTCGLLAGLAAQAVAVLKRR